MRRCVFLLLIILLILCGCNSAGAGADTTASVLGGGAETTGLPVVDGSTLDTDKEPVATPDPDYENDAPEYYEDDFIRTPTDVMLDMYRADFWMRDSYNEVVMTPEEIEYYNSRAAAELGSSSIGYYSLNSVPSTVSYEFVYYFVENYVPDFYKNYYVGGEVKSYSWWQDVIENTNASAIPSTTSVKYGYSVLYSTLRIYPVAEFMTNDYNNQLDDICSAGALRPYQRVIVISESADGEWYYALTDSASGWVKKEEIALCRSRSDWMERNAPDNFLVVTGKEFRMTYEFTAPEYSGLLLPMGTVLPLVLAEDAPEFVNDRMTYGNYVVKLPTRDSDGYIKDKYALIPLSADVHIGYMEYTRNNVLELAFKFIGDIYGFKGAFYSVNCSGLTSAVFSCFGLRLPGLATNQQRAGFELERIVLEGMSIDEKKTVLDTLDAGTILYFTEHVMIYLGEYNGEYYCISATAGYHGVEGREGEVPFLYNVSVNTLEVYRDSGLSWFEELWSIQLVRYKK